MREAVILSGAEADLLAAYCWFEALDSALADRFDQTVHAVIHRLQEFPSSAPPFRNKYRRSVVPGFSHGLFYTIEGNSRIAIHAVLDLRQDPGTILRRLGLDED